MGLGVLWIDVPLGVACLLAGLHHVGLAVGRRAPVWSALAYGLMGFGMAAMFVPALDPVPRPVWVAVFGASLVWFGAGASRRGGSLFGDAGHHVVGAVAMLFMLLGESHAAMSGTGATDGMSGMDMGGSGALGSGLLTAAVALALSAWFLADIVRLLTRPAPVADPVVAEPVAAAVGAAEGVIPAAPPVSYALVRGVPLACLTMNAAMVVMLVVMA